MIELIKRIIKYMTGQLGQAPEPNQNAAFLQRETALKPIIVGHTVIQLRSLTFGSNASVTVDHNLNFRPAVIAYAISPGGFNVPLPSLTFTYGSTVNEAFSDTHIQDLTSVLYVTDTQIVFTFQCGQSFPSDYDLPIRYYLLDSRAATT